MYSISLNKKFYNGDTYGTASSLLVEYLSISLFEYIGLPSYDVYVTFWGASLLRQILKGVLNQGQFVIHLLLLEMFSSSCWCW